MTSDPIGAMYAIKKPEELLTGGFKKNEEAAADVTAGLAELTVPAGPQGISDIKGVEGFEGGYGDLEYDEPDGGFGDFEGLTDAFGGGLDPTEFGASTVEEKERRTHTLVWKDSDTKDAQTEGSAGGAVFGVDGSEDSKGPVLWLTEDIPAECEGAALTRVALQGVLHLLTVRPSVSKEDTEFSFSLEGAASIKRCTH